MQKKLTELEEIFPPEIIKKEDITGIPPEVSGYQNDFGNRAWNEVPNEIYNRHTDAFSLMDHSTLVYYVAGYLKAIDDDPNSLASECVIYFAGQKGFLEFCKLLNDEQKSLLCNKLHKLVVEDDYCRDSERLRVLENTESILKKLNEKA